MYVLFEYLIQLPTIFLKEMFQDCWTKKHARISFSKKRIAGYGSVLFHSKFISKTKNEFQLRQRSPHYFHLTGT